MPRSVGAYELLSFSANKRPNHKYSSYIICFCQEVPKRSHPGLFTICTILKSLAGILHFILEYASSGMDDSNF